MPVRSKTRRGELGLVYFSSAFRYNCRGWQGQRGSIISLSSMTSFLSQLKQRRVYRVAIGYAVVAWLMVQIAATVLPAFHAPELVLPVLIVLLGVGFPVALVLAWAFDVTPSGIEKTPEEAGTTAARNTRHAWVLAGLGLLIAAVGVGAYWWWHRPVTIRAASTEPSNPMAEKSANNPVTPVSEKSIAVLPFENLSSD